MEPPLSFCFCRRRRQRAKGGSGVAAATTAVRSSGFRNGVPLTSRGRGEGSGVDGGASSGGNDGCATDGRTVVPGLTFADGNSVPASAGAAFSASRRDADPHGG